MRTLTLSALLAASVITHVDQAQATSGSAPPASTSAPAETTPSPGTSSTPTPSPSATTTPSAPAPAPQPPIATPVPPATPTRQMSVSALEDKDLIGANSGEVGDIESVVESNADKKRFIVISRGGFLGFFETEVAIPLENVAVRNDQIVLQNLTEEQLKALPKYENNNAYRELDDNESISLTEAK
jgi:sporulation protein YlmC with PRC-barrel domain